CAVLGHVSDDVTGAAGLLEPVDDRPQVSAVAGPAARGERGAADVEADGNGLAVLADDVGRPLGVLERGGSEVDALRTGGESRFERGIITDAAGQLHLDAADLLDHLADHAGV